MWFYFLIFIFSLMTPFSTVTVLINTVSLAGLLSHLKFKTMLIFLLLYACIINYYWRGPLLLFGLISFITAWLVWHYYLNKTKFKPALILITLLLGIFLIGFSDGKQLKDYLINPPQPPYQTDMAAYLQVVYNLKQNKLFYPSFADQIKLRLNQNYPGELWGWKQPLLFYIFKLLPGPVSSIAIFSYLNFSLCLLSAYLIARKFLSPQLSLASPILLLGYFHYPLIEPTIIQLEWWALSTFIFAFTAVLYRRYLLAGILFALTLAIRELFAVPIVFIGILFLFKKNWQVFTKLSLPGLLLFLPYYIFIHINNVIKFEPLSLLLSNSIRSQAATGWSLIRPTLAYGSWNYALFQFQPFLFLLAITSSALIYSYYKKRRFNELLLLGSYLPFFLSCFKLGIMDLWHDYWGIYYIPLLLISAPIAFSLIQTYLSQWVKVYFRPAWHHLFR